MSAIMHPGPVLMLGGVAGLGIGLTIAGPAALSW
jgi:hypothetical protein